MRYAQMIRKRTFGGGERTAEALTSGSFLVGDTLLIRWLACNIFASISSSKHARSKYWLLPGVPSDWDSSLEFPGSATPVSATLTKELRIGESVASNWKSFF